MKKFLILLPNGAKSEVWAENTEKIVLIFPAGSVFIVIS